MNDHAVHDRAPIELGRRRLLGYLVAAPTLAVAVRLGADTLAPDSAGAAVPTPDGPAEIYDLNDMLTSAAMPTAGPDHAHDEDRRHRPLRAAALGERPGHRHLDGDDHRRGARHPGRQGGRHARRRATGAALQPAHRRLQHHASRPTSRSAPPPPSPAAACSRPPPLQLENVPVTALRTPREWSSHPTGPSSPTARSPRPPRSAGRRRSRPSSRAGPTSRSSASPTTAPTRATP